jgi:hypothetical protein
MIYLLSIQVMILCSKSIYVIWKNKKSYEYIMNNVVYKHSNQNYAWIKGGN